MWSNFSSFFPRVPRRGTRENMRYAIDRQERMLPKESKNVEEERSKNSEEVATPEFEKEKVCEEESSSQQRRGLAPRKDSVHPTFLMVNKCDHNELRRKFRNYEI